MGSAPRWVRVVGYLVLWLAIAVFASALRSLIPREFQELATVVAVAILAVLLVAILVRQAGPMARTLRSWRDQL